MDGSARRLTRLRRTWRSCGRAVVRVLAAASELGDGVACSAMAERLSSVAARGGGDGNEN